MILNRNDLTEKINRIKSVANRKTPMPVVQCLYIHDGYLIASDSELTVSVKLEGTEGQSVLLPPKAFALIPAMESTEISIEQDKNFHLEISGGSIRTKIKGMDPNLFPMTAEQKTDAVNTTTLPADVLMQALKAVLWSIEEKGVNDMMRSVGIRAKDGKLNFCGINNAQMAWYHCDCEGEWNMVLPKPAAKALLQLGLQGDVQITSGNRFAEFRTEGCTLRTRLTESRYLEYTKMFRDMPCSADVDRRSFVRTLERVNLISEDVVRAPVGLKLENDVMHVEYAGTSVYREDLTMDTVAPKPVEIWFDAKKLLALLQAYGEETIHLNLESPKMPMITSAEESSLTGLILPVRRKA